MGALILVKAQSLKPPYTLENRIPFVVKWWRNQEARQQHRYSPRTYNYMFHQLIVYVLTSK